MDENFNKKKKVTLNRVDGWKCVCPSVWCFDSSVPAVPGIGYVMAGYLVSSQSTQQRNNRNDRDQTTDKAIHWEWSNRIEKNELELKKKREKTTIWFLYNLKRP